MPLPRLRQVALAAHDLHVTSKALQETFGWPETFYDPGVGEFGLQNSVFAAGDTFLEVVSPVRPGTTAGRYLERRGGDTGYMAIFQVEDVHEARRRASAEGLRVVWSVDLPDVAGTHLHPKDTPGAIVSLDWADPPETWRWAGPDWTAKATPNAAGSIRGLVIEVKDPAVAAQRWAAAVGLDAAGGGDVAEVDLAAAQQFLRFSRMSGHGAEGIAEIWFEQGESAAPHETEIAGVRFVVGRDGREGR